MTPDEVLIITKLASCKFSPGTWAKRFVNDLMNLPYTTELTEKQREWIYRVLYQKRKSLPHTYNKFSKHPHCKPLQKGKPTEKILPHVAGDWKPQRTNGDLKRGNGGVQTTLPIF